MQPRCGFRRSPWPLGTVVLALAFVDELVMELLGRRARQNPDEQLRNE